MVPEKYRIALVLRDIEGFAYEEIGQMLGIPGGTVRSRINRARGTVGRRIRPIEELADNATFTYVFNNESNLEGVTIPAGTTRTFSLIADLIGVGLLLNVHMRRFS